MPRVHRIGFLDWSSDVSNHSRAGRARLSEFHSSSHFDERFWAKALNDEVVDDVNRCTDLSWTLTLDTPIKQSSSSWAFVALLDDGTIHTTVEYLVEENQNVDQEDTLLGETAFLTGIPANLLASLLRLTKQKGWQMVHLTVCPEKRDRIDVKISMPLTVIRFSSKYLNAATQRLNKLLREAQ